MKKILIAVIALVLVLSLCTAAFAEMEYITIENTPSYEGTWVALDDAGTLGVYMPNDWTYTENDPEFGGYVFTNAEGSLNFAIVSTDADMNEMMGSYQAMMDNGELSEFMMANINGVDFVLVTNSDNTASQACCGVNDVVYIFDFSYLPGTDSTVALEILGSLKAL